MNQSEKEERINDIKLQLERGDLGLIKSTELKDELRELTGEAQEAEEARRKEVTDSCAGGSCSA